MLAVSAGLAELLRPEALAEPPKIVSDLRSGIFLDQI
jgi:hypothetical protein